MAVHRIGIGLDVVRRNANKAILFPVVSVTWAGTSDPSLTIGEITLPVTSIKWAGTSSPSLTLNEINLPVYTITWEGTSSPNLNVT